MTYWYGLATGAVKPWIKASRNAVKFMTDQEGFIGVHPTPDCRYTMWFFDTLNNAKRARNRGENKGIQFGYNISVFEVGDNGVPMWVRIA